MAINILTNPSTSAPVENDDWTYLYSQVTAGAVPQGSILTDWESTTAAPDLKQGSFIRYEGNLYQVQTEDYTISGTVSAGVNYIVLTLVGTTLTAAWVTDISGYSYDAAYGGMYNTNSPRKMLLPDLCYLDGTDYHRGKGFAEGVDVYRLADGVYGGVFLPQSPFLSAGINAITLEGIFTKTGTLGALYDALSSRYNTTSVEPTYSGLTLTSSISCCGTVYVTPGSQFCPINYITVRTSSMKLFFQHSSGQYSVEFDTNGEITSVLPSGQTLATFNLVVN